MRYISEIHVYTLVGHVRFSSAIDQTVIRDHIYIDPVEPGIDCVHYDLCGVLDLPLR